ncbi:hypothetical protein ACNRBV_04090 [Ralstonia pseudosolanacearum]|uniref:Replication-associated protein ORF2/G2P domain-containing protein n=1 Tax=Ralstonia solanacearum TaxID=305 RepID=A0A0S4WUA6_RALSL|nr:MULTISPECIES: hypothetical protein [Ralstonia]UZF17380.1 hypothetical protein LH706_25880 [Ralstonia solanacearum]MCK4140589.1 hypothetical protein [Ralstonia pseudosolanacearum]RAA05998.1 hypothetical protein DOT66_20730 [Ralstonia pseudosolanacearum]UQY85140.1 hypothetical protein JNO62_18085 [Ralstonia pseudosolanacearum]UZF27083.1 hypothetical protein LGV80_23530 [Ralstonia sp. RS642]
MRHDIVGERASFDKGYSYQEGIAVRFRVFPNGQAEVSGFPMTQWDRVAELRQLPRAARGQSEKREQNEASAAQRAKQAIRLRCKAISASVMLTLSTRDPITELDEFMKLFDRFRRIMSKARVFHYVAVPERQKRGAWHLHIAVEGRVARHFAIRAWLRVVGGKGKGYCHIRNPNGGKGRGPWDQHKLAAYISKYIGKDVGDRDLNRKRYWTSRGIVVPQRAVYGNWGAYPSMYEALKPVLADLHAQFGIHDLVAHVSARDGSFWLATGPRPGHFYGPPSPFVTEYERFLGSLH